METSSAGLSPVLEILCNSVCDLGDHLIEDLNVVVGQVEEHQAPKSTKCPLFYLEDVTALQGQVSQVGRMFERSSWKFLDIITSKI